MIRGSAAFAAGCLRSSAMPRLLRFIIMNALDSPLTSGGVKRRVSSPSGTRSTLITSAPMSASSMPAVGPDMMCATSMTLSPESGPMASPLFAAEARIALGKECGDSLAEIRRVEAGVAFAPISVRQLRGWAQAPDELLVPARDQRRAGGDARRNGARLRLDLVVGDDALHQSLVERFLCAEDATFEQDLPRDRRT